MTHAETSDPVALDLRVVIRRIVVRVAPSPATASRDERAPTGSLLRAADEAARPSRSR